MSKITRLMIDVKTDDSVKKEFFRPITGFNRCTSFYSGSSGDGDLVLTFIPVDEPGRYSIDFIYSDNCVLSNAGERISTAIGRSLAFEKSVSEDVPAGEIRCSIPEFLFYDKKARRLSSGAYKINRLLSTLYNYLQDAF